MLNFIDDLENVICFYTDGSCKGNPGEGGFGVVGFSPKEETPDTTKLDVIAFHSSSCDYTTNNREELKAILWTCQLIEEQYQKKNCIIYCDSAYCVNAINSWMKGWAEKGWINSKKKEVENKDLFLQLYDYFITKKLNCQLVKIPGHSGILGNEMADALATKNINKFDKLMKEID